MTVFVVVEQAWEDVTGIEVFSDMRSAILYIHERIIQNSPNVSEADIEESIKETNMYGDFTIFPCIVKNS